MEYWEEWERGPTTGYTYQATPPWVHHHHPGYTARGDRRDGSGAMGSKLGVRNSQKATEVNLSETICLLAAFWLPCCKNWPYPKAPDYLGLSIPLVILSRVSTLP